MSVSNSMEPHADTDTCPLSLDDHIELAITALTLFGLGLGCETEYRALLVLAETARLVHGHAAFDPRAEAEKLVQQAREAEAKVAVVRAEMEQSALMAMTDGGPVH